MNSSQIYCIISRYLTTAIIFAIMLVWLFPFTALADPQQDAAIEAQNFVILFSEVILTPLIALLTGVAFLVFLYGCAMYIFNATNDQARSQGRQHIIFGLIGLLVMVSAWAILTIASNTFGLKEQQDCANDPTAGGCADVFKIEAKV
jgi:hypothetical protein